MSACRSRSRANERFLLAGARALSYGAGIVARRLMLVLVLMVVVMFVVLMLMLMLVVVVESGVVVGALMLQLEGVPIGRLVEGGLSRLFGELLLPAGLELGAVQFAHLQESQTIVCHGLLGGLLLVMVVGVAVVLVVADELPVVESELARVAGRQALVGLMVVAALLQVGPSRRLAVGRLAEWVMVVVVVVTVCVLVVLVAARMVATGAHACTFEGHQIGLLVGGRRAAVLLVVSGQYGL